MARKQNQRLRAKSLGEFIDRVSEVMDSWAYPEEGNKAAYFNPWFRGHRDKKWQLLPKVRRPQFACLNEADIRREYRCRALSYVKHPYPQTDWDWLFLMQHYGLPTRLLDWTESCLTALYFAVTEPYRDVDAAVWMLDPFHLNKTVAGVGPYIQDVFSPCLRKYLPDDRRDLPNVPDDIPEPPMAIDPAYNSPRIMAQRGMFTIHGSNATPLEEWDAMADRCMKIVIPKDSLRDIKFQLGWAGIRETNVFPELASVGREICDYGLWGDTE
ncbi:MAG: FRG domain-containing protein [Planctomycetota bacterium]|jgi:hypothetical protein